MSCYSRHLGDLLSLAGIENTKENRRRADGYLRQIVGKEEEDCPVVWKEVKARLARPEESLELAQRLHEIWEEG